MKDYKMIRTWGKLMGSYQYYIDIQVKKAISDNAPFNATYKRNGKWRTVNDIENTDLLKRLVNTLI